MVRHPCSVFVVCFIGLTLLAGCGGSSADGSAAGSPSSGSPSSGTTPPTSSPPSITTQPASQTVMSGQVATFNVVASGSSALSYQWLGNGAAIAGATAASYTTQATTAQTSGIAFTVTVTDAGGSVTSSAATLTVTTPKLRGGSKHSRYDYGDGRISKPN